MNRKVTITVTDDDEHIEVSAEFEPAVKGEGTLVEHLGVKGLKAIKDELERLRRDSIQ